MSNGELLERLLDMVKFGWIRVGVCWTTRLQNIAQNTRILPKLQNITQNYPSARMLPKITQISHKLHKNVQVLRARPTQSMAHLTIAITLPLIVSRKGWLTQPQPSPLPLFYSL